MEIKKIINLFRKAEGYIGLNAAYAKEIADFLEEYERRAENLVHHNADLNHRLNKAESHIEKMGKQKEAMLKELCDKEALVREAEGRFYELENKNRRLSELLVRKTALDGGRAQRPSPTMEWISVEDERKPEEGESCLVRSRTDCIAIRKYEKGGFPDNHRIRYWMHNPDLPKPKEPSFKDVFLKQNPQARKDERFPICYVYPHIKDVLCDKTTTCKYCWNQPYFEEEGEADA